MTKEKNKRLKISVITMAAICILCSMVYLVYDLIWIPYHFAKLNDEISSSENAECDDAQGDLSVQEKFRFIKSKYPDFSGRIMIENLGLDFPVAQCDDNEYYLKHTLDGKTDKHGTLFVDCRNSIEVLNQNTLIYGHNMKDNTQFGLLNVYKTVEGYKTSPVVTFSTIYKDYNWKIFAAFLINTKPEDDDGYVFDYTRTEFSSAEEFESFYDEVMERSYFITDTDVTCNDKLLTMSTCSTLFDDSRLVVMARLARDGENLTDDTQSVRANDNQRFPSAFENDK